MNVEEAYEWWILVGGDCECKDEKKEKMDAWMDKCMHIKHWGINEWVGQID